MPAREEITNKSHGTFYPNKSPERGACWTSHASRQYSGRKLFLGFIFLVLLMIYFSYYRGTNVHCRKFGYVYINLCIYI